MLVEGMFIGGHASMLAGACVAALDLRRFGAWRALLLLSTSLSSMLVCHCSSMDAIWLWKVR